MTNKLKLLLLSIMGIGLGLSFCSSSFCDINSSSADVYLGNMGDGTYNIIPTQQNSVEIVVDNGYSVLLNTFDDSIPFYLFDSDFNLIGQYSQYFFLPAGTYYINTSGSVFGNPNSTYSYSKTHTFSHFTVNLPDTDYFPIFNFFSYFYYNVSQFSYSSQGGGSSNIDVFYNNGNSVENITCDGVQAIQIDGLSTITSTNTFTPYFNISYTDEDNQSLIESYSKDILYLSGGLFKKTYTGNNERILTDTIESPNSSFTGYVPVFDFTGDTIVNTGNVFNNFSDNALKVLLSNIPSYIQYITIFAILVFLFSFIRRFKRKS